MPTNTNAYNSRVTDEALEKRFRDTFRSQGGAELVDDLYAQGVIVPVVDFTAAATGQQLAQNLQTAWDFSTAHYVVDNTTTTIASNAGFWQVSLILNGDFARGTGPISSGNVSITDGLSSKIIWSLHEAQISVNENDVAVSGNFVAFLRSGDSLTCTSASSLGIFTIWTRQIATISGDLVNPSGFTSS